MKQRVRKGIAHPEPAFPFTPTDYPEHPGCYLMYDRDDRLLYVGKAKNLRSRLSSYFRNSATPHRKAEMISRIARIDIFLVRNEREALVLESNLIRHRKPPYNSRFTNKGDSYYYIALSEEPFPRLVPYRRERVNYALIDADGQYAALFGPYMGWRLRNRLLDTIRGIHPLRTCHSLPDKACIRAESGLCSAPCIGSIDADEYRDLVRQAVQALRSPPVRLLREIREQMQERSRQLDYDEARKLRDRLCALEHAALPQIAELDRQLDAEVVWLEDGRITVLSVRAGCTVELWFDEVAAAIRRISQQPDIAQIIANQPSANLFAWTPSLHIPVRVPKTSTSQMGQLLRLCQMNHRHRFQESITYD